MIRYRNFGFDMNTATCFTLSPQKMRLMVWSMSASVMILVFLLTACSTKDFPQSVTSTSTLPLPEATAILDWENASITLPLDGYGMSPDEYHLVTAAASIVFAKCVTGNSDPDKSVIDEARRALVPIKPDPVATHWLFSIWDAPFVAAHGWRPFPEEEPPPVLMKANSDAAGRCLQDSEYVTLMPISATAFPEEFDLIARFAGEAYEKTLADSHYQVLLEGLGQCIRQAGYSVMSEEEGGGVVLNSSWTEEQKLKAMLASAQCDDGLAFTQQAANIDAKYQMEYVVGHQTELVAVRSEVNHRLDEATHILHEVGVL